MLNDLCIVEFSSHYIIFEHIFQFIQKGGYKHDGFENEFDEETEGYLLHNKKFKKLVICCIS